ncbi:MAG: Cna B-type domain-containing protein, partial [Butyrivibrio sp.]|nr:Cna B-type domain-containing protein [Butyrivibrio sp.]
MPIKIRDIKENQIGATLVEMIVSFALIGIFLAATFTAISSALLSYYHEREIMTAYTVADTVLSAIKDDIHTMRPQRAQNSDGTIEALDGYVKLRTGSDQSSVGKTVTGTTIDADEDGTADYYGDTLEFLRASTYSITDDDASDTDVSFAQTISTSGFAGTLYKNTDVISVDYDGNTGAISRAPGYLTLRYYSKYSGTDTTYEGLYADLYMNDDVLSTDVSVSRGLSEKLGVDYYHRLYVDLHFFIPQSALETDTLSVNETASFVRFVGATVDVYREYDTSSDTYSDLMYSKTEYIDIQNDVWFADYDTLYSDLSDSSLPDKPEKKDLTSTTTISGEVVFDDSSDIKGYRPDSVTVTLTSSGGDTESEEIFSDGTSSWDYSFEVPVYDEDGTALTYSVTGSSVDKYEMSVSGYTITYSYDPYTDITFVLDAGDGVT